MVLACGGFQANHEMMRAHFGPGGEAVPCLRRARISTPATAFAWRSMPAPISPVSATACTSSPLIRAARTRRRWVLLYPYGIVVDRSGKRFFDEGAGLVHETWERFSRQLHFEVPGRTAFAILDARVRQIPDWQRATRSRFRLTRPARSRTSPA